MITYSKQAHSPIIVKSRKGGYQFVNCEDIAYCKAEGSYTVLHLTNGNTLIIAKSLHTVNDMIGNNNLIRCHRSFVVNIEMVRETDRHHRTLTVLEQAIPVSRRKCCEVLKEIKSRSNKLQHIKNCFAQQLLSTMITDVKKRHRIVFVIRAVFLLTCLMLYMPVYSQTGVTVEEVLSARMETLSCKAAPELGYIQTSKGIYEPMEDLWFKVYLLDALSLVPSSRSRTLYLQMFREGTNEVVWEERYEVRGGFVSGHVYLHDTLETGDYLLAAYTRCSFYGDSTDLKAVRRVQVRKELKPNHDGWMEPLKTPSQEGKRAIQFNTFPEGGYLVSGIISRLAFKAVDTDGMPVEVEGTLYEDGVAKEEFRSVHAGMGSIEFTPRGGSKYSIRLREPGDNDSIYILPDVKGEGITMRLSGRGAGFLEFKISRGGTAERRQVWLRGQIRGVVCCMATGVLNKELKIKVLTGDLPQGIAEFTVFDDSMTAVTERLVYINKGKELQIEAEPEKDRYAVKEKARIKLTVRDNEGRPVMAHLGVSVYDKLYRNGSDAENIVTHCYLASQIRGMVYDPGYYFEGNDEERELALDLLMQTQGWRRYIWSMSLLSGNEGGAGEVIEDETKGEVHATVRKRESRSVQQVIKVFYPGNTETADLLFADSLGRFTITPLHLKTGQGGYVYLKAMDPDYKPQIIIADPFQIINEVMRVKGACYPVAGPEPEKKEKEEWVDPYVEGHRTVRLPEVTVTAGGRPLYRDKYIGHLDSLAGLDLNTDYVSPCGFLNCPICGSGSKPVEGETYSVWAGRRPYPGSHPFSFTADEVKFVTYHYPKFSEEELLRKNNMWRVKGYYADREFYEPDYDKEPWRYTVADFRNTLLWAPEVITDEKGEATVEFYCSDLNTGFVVSIEGISGEGLPGMKETEIKVIRTGPEKQK